MHVFPLVAFYFKLECLDQHGVLETTDLYFKSIHGLKKKYVTETIQEGGQNLHDYALPKNIKYTPLTLKGGILPCDSAFEQWCLDQFNHGLEKPIETKQLQLSLMHPHEKTPAKQWQIFNAWPIQWQLKPLHAEQNQLAIQEIQFSYQYFKTL